MRRFFKISTPVWCALGAVFTVLYCVYGKDALLSAAITFWTFFYHFAMRLAVGGIVNARREKCRVSARRFAPLKFESALYKRLRVRRWKDKMPTYAPESFDGKKLGLEGVIRTMCVSETVHEIIIIFSFLPLFAAIPFDSFWVFFITSLLAAFYDLLFVIMQRYNRPRLVKLANKKAR
ncbi:MAG: hypothetical protein IJP23_04580 [Oscillospiraceae bacterium]|nr:hypothetical protein [Oscillospiraceae bacterium]